MYIPRFISTLSYALFLLATLNARNAIGTKTSNSGAQAVSKCHNMYTYNSFYAGTNKKIEALLREVKIELSEIREEIKCMKGNETKKGRSILSFIVVFSSTSRAKLSVRLSASINRQRLQSASLPLIILVLFLKFNQLRALNFFNSFFL